MKEINNLIYTLEISYKNQSGIDTSISIKFCDNGLKVKSLKIGGTCVTEETINGRVLSGKFENLDGFCGYRYDYQNGENLLNINPNTPISTAISLINSTKMASDFISADLVLSSISRNDYRVVILKKGNLNITKTISAENEKSEHCSVQENIELLKLEGEESFVEQSKKRLYKIDNKCVIESDNVLVDSDIKLELSELADILSQHPQNYKELIEFKNQIQNSIIHNSTNEEKCYE